MKIKYIWVLMVIVAMAGCTEKESGVVQPADGNRDEALRSDSVDLLLRNNKVDKKKILDLVNELRRVGCRCETNGVVTDLPPTSSVKWSTDLERIAYQHSLDMDENNYLSHTSLDGRTMKKRYEQIGYKLIPDGTPNQGENVASGQKTEEEVFNSWKNSKKGHCNTMMNPHVNEMGVGFSNKNEAKWTQNFGRR